MKIKSLSKVLAFMLAAVVSSAAFAQASKAAAPAAAPAAAVKKTLIVNGVTIPASRYDALMAEAKAQGMPDTPEAAAQIKDELVTREVLFQAAAKQGLEKQADVAAQLETARQGVLVRAYVESQSKKSTVSDADMKKQYDDMKKQMGDSEFKARHILVEKEDEAKAVLAELSKGGDFAKIAKEKTKDTGSKDNGGDLDWGPAGRYVKPFADALRALKKGETTTAPVKSDFGFHIIRLDDVRPMKYPSFEEMKPNFQQRAQQEQVGKLIQDLKSRAKVEER